VIFGKGKEMNKRYVTTVVLAMASVIVLAGSLPSGAMVELEPDEGSISVIEEHESGLMATVRIFSKEEINRQIERLRRADPEKAKELEALREEDPEKFKAEFRKVSLGRVGKEASGRRAPCGCGSLTFSRWLEENYPEEAKKLAELKDKDPALHRKRYALLHKRYGKIYKAAKDNPDLAAILKVDLELKEKRDELLEQMGKLRIVYDESSENEVKKECEEKITTCRRQLEGVLAKRFDLIVKRKEIEFEQLLEKLKKLQEQVQKSNAELENWRDPEFMRGSVKARLAELLGERDKFRWE
jgi:hypothetical protein